MSDQTNKDPSEITTSLVRAAFLGAIAGYVIASVSSIESLLEQILEALNK